MQVAPPEEDYALYSKSEKEGLNLQRAVARTRAKLDVSGALYCT